MKVASEQMWIVGELADGKSFTTQKLGEATLESARQYDAPLEYITVNSPMNRL